MNTQNIQGLIADVLRSEREQIENSRRGDEFKCGRLEQQLRIEAAIAMLFEGVTR